MAAYVKTSDPTYIGILGHSKVGAPAERRMTEITDGTSNTMLLAECAGRNRRFIMGKEDPSQTWTAGPWANPASRISIGGFNPSNPSDPYGPCAVNCVNDKEIYSFHTGGANLVMGDGSVRFLKATVTLDVALQLLTRARGEVLQDPF
jgi:prepilin-type processing-associated H-X9-DG protein